VLDRKHWLAASILLRCGFGELSTAELRRLLAVTAIDRFTGVFEFAICLISRYG